MDFILLCYDVISDTATDTQTVRKPLKGYVCIRII